MCDSMDDHYCDTGWDSHYGCVSEYALEDAYEERDKAEARADALWAALNQLYNSGTFRDHLAAGEALKEHRRA